jgi:hypothetical protein
MEACTKICSRRRAREITGHTGKTVAQARFRLHNPRRRLHDFFFVDDDGSLLWDFNAC